MVNENMPTPGFPDFSRTREELSEVIIVLHGNMSWPDPACRRINGPVLIAMDGIMANLDG